MSNMKFNGDYSPKGSRIKEILIIKETLIDMLNNQYLHNTLEEKEEVYEVAKKEWGKWEDWKISSHVTFYSYTKETKEEKMNYIKGKYSPSENPKMFVGESCFIMMNTKQHNRCHVYMQETE